jgi:hypothetical protein|tara:strand:+ start:423 stop:935 length:513 start_codon:yes stop_codon:yes gene_type:complete
MTSKIINFILFQLVWFACILGAAINETHTAVAFSLLIILFHFYLAKDKKNEIKILLIASIIGFLFDGFLLKSELVLYTNHGWSYSITPLWIIVLWMGFAITLNSSLNWLKKKIKLSALFGAIGGPLAYLAGEKLEAVTLMTPIALIAIVIGWSLITPLLIYISRRISLDA